MPPGGRHDQPAQSLIEGILQREEPHAPPRDLESELLTFLFADIRGYTRFTQERGDEAAERLTARFAHIVRELVPRFGGTVLELRGDEALCVFTSPRRCVRLAVELQQRFVEEATLDSRDALAVGIGIDAGEAVHGPDGYRGGALNLAARLCAHAKAGEILATAEVTHLARTIDGIRYSPLDRVAMKGLRDSIRPVRVVPDGEDPARQIAALLSAASPAARDRRTSWLPRRVVSRPRTAIAVATVVAALAIGALVALVARDSPRNLKAVSENSIGVVDPGTGHIVDQIRVDDGPVAAATGFGSVWTVNSDAGTVSRVDIASHQVRVIPVGVTPSAVAVGMKAVWVANSGSGTVSRIDPATNQPQTIAGVASPAGIAVADGSVWVTNTANGTVSRLDPAKNAVAESIEVGDSPSGISAGRDLWIANSASNTVSRINLSSPTHAVTDFNVGACPKGVLVVGDNVWVTNNLDGTISRISIPTSAVETVRVGNQPSQLANVRNRVWVATQNPGDIVEIDPTTMRPVRRVGVGPIAGGLVEAGNKLWVTATIDPALHRGGVLRILGDDVAADPEYLVSPAQLALLNSVYDGLVGFRHATGTDGTTIVPDLAVAIPTPSNRGRTYTFQIRDGIRWSTGQPLTVFDIRRGIERSLFAPDGPLRAQIVGASTCTLKRCSIAGITVDERVRTVSITLVRPNANFIDELIGSPAAPAATPLAEQKTRPIPSTGPYRIASYEPGKRVVLSRNSFFREWSAAAQPDGFADRIEWQVNPGDDRDRSLAEVAAGTTDWADARGAGGGIGDLQARFGSRVHVTPTENLHALSLNTRIPPFNDVRVRQALAYAIDRNAVARAWFTPAQVTCQILPPNYPGYRPFCPYALHPDGSGSYDAPNIAAAQHLLQHVRPIKKTITVFSEASGADAFKEVVVALKLLGYHARLRVWTGSDESYFRYVGDSRNNVQAAFYGWVTSDASADNLLGLYTCAAFHPGNGATNENPAQFCDPSMDRLQAQARRVQTTSLADADRMWAEVDRRLVDEAPWIPLVTPSWVDVVSQRVHNFERSPVLGVLFGQLRVR